MANWKVIAMISGNIEAVSGPAAQDRPGTHERIVWEGEAADKAKALKCAEKADPRVDLEWMRIRHERERASRGTKLMRAGSSCSRSPAMCWLGVTMTPQTGSMATISKRPHGRWTPISSCTAWKAPGGTSRGILL